MVSKAKTTEYAQKIKSLLVQMAIDDKLPLDMTTLDITGIESILAPVFNVLEALQTDAEMALDGSWDCTTTEGVETGFDAQLSLIDSL